LPRTPHGAPPDNLARFKGTASQRRRKGRVKRAGGKGGEESREGMKGEMERKGRGRWRGKEG